MNVHGGVGASVVAEGRDSGMRNPVWRFNGFRYSADLGLERGGEAISLGPQARRLLELLLESGGEVVSKESIAARIWPDRSVSDGSIDRCAYLLRKPLKEACGDDIIATSYGKGLSLRARIDLVDQAAPSTEAHSARTLDLWQIAYEVAGARSRAGLERAQLALDELAKVDPDSAAMWALASDLYIARAIRGFMAPRHAAALIESAAGRGLAIARKFAPALASLGWAMGALRGRAEEGLSLLDRASALDPHYAKIRAYRAWLLCRLGRLSEAIAEVDEGLRSNPLDRVLLSVRPWIEFYDGDFERSLLMARQALDLRPDIEAAYLVVAVSASRLGRHDEALAAAQRAIELSGREPFFLSVLADALALADKKDEAESALDEALAGDGYVGPPILLAAPALALGRRGEALELLRRAGEDGCPWLCFAVADPRLAPLREEIARLGASFPRWA